MKKLILASAMLALLTGCNTLRGMGEDLQDMGSWMSSSAEKGVPSVGSADKITPAADAYSYPGDVRSRHLD